SSKSGSSAMSGKSSSDSSSSSSSSSSDCTVGNNSTDPSKINCLNNGCPDLRGVWRSGLYDVLQVTPTGNKVLSGLNMSLDVSLFPGHTDDGCEIVLENRWTYDGTTRVEKMAGVVHGRPGVEGEVYLTVVELPTASDATADAVITTAQLRIKYYPAAGATPAYIDFDYAALGGTSDSSWANVFSTHLTQGSETHPEPACPDVRGVWRSGLYDVLQVTPTSNKVLSGLNMSLEISLFPGHTDNCEIVLENRWTYDGTTRVEKMAGVVHARPDVEGEVYLTVVELPTASDATADAVITTAQLRIKYYPAAGATPAYIDFDYAALGGTSDSSWANVFSTHLTQGSETLPEPACPDVSGVWRSGLYDMLEVTPTSNKVLSGKNMSLEISLFPGNTDNCEIVLENRWTYDGTTTVEAMAGVVHAEGPDGEGGVYITAVELPPANDATADAVITTAQLRIKYYPAAGATPAYIDFDYAAVGGTSDSSRANVFSTHLTLGNPSMDRGLDP
ncbi:hypothetical protein TeGR_g14665, partial [Tetraparma gracilis]